MKKTNFFWVVCLLLAVCSCSKKENEAKNSGTKTNEATTKGFDVQIISNKSKPKYPNMKLKLDNIFSFENKGDNAEIMVMISPFRVDFDSQKNLYILDDQKCKIHKFSPTGEYLLSFGGQGEGPGEFMIAGSTVIINDTIIVPFWLQSKFVLFDTEGKYIKDIKYADEKSMAYPIKYDDYLLEVNISSFTIDEKITQKQNIILFKKNLTYLKTIYENIKEKKVGTADLNEDNAPSAAMDKYNNIYIAENNPNIYKINVSSFDGKLIQVIRRDYRQVAYSEKELDKMKKQYKKLGFNRIIGTVKNSIRNIFIDKKYNYLWVETAENRDLNLKEYDVFENGVFIAKASIPIREKDVIVFRDGKIVIGNVDEGIIEVFDYDFVE